MTEKLSIKNTIVFNQNAYKILNKTLLKKQFSKVFILCDENTITHCYPILIQEIAADIEVEVIEIESGEENKDIATCQQLWDTLADLEGDRNSVLINLGGGIITDMGGFVASTFLRGIPFINIPTSLLGMVDASIGGKTGVNRKNIKNQIGVFKEPILTLIDTDYLKTLPQNELRSGLGEMYKHGLIIDSAYWKKLSDLNALDLADMGTLIDQSITIKSKVTTEDKQEQGLRKILNFGHTLGHAIESYCIAHPQKENLLHGEAIVIGMILEGYLSHKLAGLSQAEMDEIKTVLSHTYKKVVFNQEDITAILQLLKFDKKNNKGHVNFVLLEKIGLAKIDCEVPESLIYKAFEYYQR